MTPPKQDHTDRTAPVASPLALVKHLRGTGCTVIDATRHEPLAHVGTGRQPHTLAVHPGGRWGYLPYMGSNTLEVIDLWSLDVTARLEESDIGTAPVGATMTQTGSYLLVSCYGPLPDHEMPGLAVFETDDDGAVTLCQQLPVGKAGGIVVDVRNDIWVALNESSTVLRLDGDPPFETRDRFSVPDDPQDIAYAPSYGLLGVNSVDDGSVTFIDTLAGETRGTVEAPNPRGGTVVPTADRWFVGDTDGDGVTTVDLTALTGSRSSTDPSQHIPLGTPTAFTDATPDGTLLAVDAYEDDRVTFLNPETLEIVTRVQTGGSPHHPRFSADGQVCYVPNMDADTVSVIETASLGSETEAVIETIDFPDGSAPSGCFRTDRRGFL